MFAASAVSFKDLINENTINAAKKSGAAISKALEQITPEQEYYIGRAVAAQLLAQNKPYKNTKLQTYLNKICNAIVLNSDKPELYLGYRVMVLNSKEINAFATPGGHIMLTKGLVECADSEDALAAVIAHEVAHIQLQHAVKAIRSSRTQDALSEMSQVAATIASNANITSLAAAFDEGANEVVETLVNSGYSKQQEFDADTKAMTLLYDAGYDPKGLIAMLEVLAEKQPKVTGGFNSTHPAPKTRIAKAKVSLMKFKPNTTQENRIERYAAIMSGI